MGAGAAQSHRCSAGEEVFEVPAGFGQQGSALEQGRLCLILDTDYGTEVFVNT